MVNKIHAPIYQMVACIAHQEKVRYQVRLCITLRFHSPTHMDIWKEMNRLKQDENEKKLETYSYLVRPMSRISEEKDWPGLVDWTERMYKRRRLE